MIQNFSLENNVSITHMNFNIFRIIENGNWWNLHEFVSNLTIALRDNEQAMAKELLKGKNSVSDEIHVDVTKSSTWSLLYLENMFKIMQM